MLHTIKNFESTIERLKPHEYIIVYTTQKFIKNIYNNKQYDVKWIYVWVTIKLTIKHQHNITINRVTEFFRQ